MLNYLKNIILFTCVFFVLGECFVRLRNSVADIPELTIDEQGIQKYQPNQKGDFKGGTHRWNINELGWSGYLPKSYDNLITIIGDSFIENFMNPNECHQSVLLKNKMHDYNFFEAGRSGVSFIEAMEISKQLDSMSPVQNFIYVSDNDFVESLYEVNAHTNITQFSTKKDSILYGKIKSPVLKKILYNWKLMFFLYSTYPIDKILKKSHSNTSDNPVKKSDKIYDSNFYTQLTRLLHFVKKKYSLNKITLIFRPNSDKKIIELCTKTGFKVIQLNSDNDKTWTFKNDHHWTCYGHQIAAEQIYLATKNQFFSKD
jgi:hypothetical protein